MSCSDSSERRGGRSYRYGRSTGGFRGFSGGRPQLPPTYSEPMVHRGDVVRLRTQGSTTTVEQQVEVPGTGYGPWDSGRQKRWVHSGTDPKTFLPPERVKEIPGQDVRYRAQEVDRGTFEGQPARLVKIGGEERIQVRQEIPGTGYGPWDSDRQLRWRTTAYNPEGFTKSPRR